MPPRNLRTIVALALSSALAAQQPTQDELIRLRDEKLQKPVFKLADWKTDYDAVRAEAKRSGRPIFAYFTRSYAH